ncbi:MAG: peptidase T, partial [Clostridia bacterium]|nr:peptidase T [Clostridia bacterium]
MEFNALLPPDEVCEKTEGYEGFFHLHTMMGGTVETDLHYLIRDHDMAAFERRKAQMIEAAEEINRRYGPGTATAVIRDSYYNMKEKILPHMHLISRAEEAFRANGIVPMIIPIRGGTDGARLSWDGLPCPNISTGGYNFHGVREWIPVSSLEKMTGVIVSLAQSFVK